MRAVYKKLGLAGLILAGLVVTGCLVSGTFVIVEDVEFNFQAGDDFYWYPIDLTAESDWADHKDDINNIDAIGFEFKIENTSATACEFNVWFAPATGVANPLDPPSSIPSDAVKVINGLTVAAGATTTVTYAESQGHISNLAAFKAIVKSGRFDYYGTSCGDTGSDEFEVTDGKIIITVSASGA